MPAAAPARKRILMVDDDQDFLDSCKAVLESENYEVLTANDGAAGLELARGSKPDLIVMDMMMATTTEGMEISRRIRETPELRHLRLIMITGARSAMHLPFRFEPDPHHLPVDAVLEKPLSPAALLHEVRKHLNNA